MKTNYPVLGVFVLIALAIVGAAYWLGTQNPPAPVIISAPVHRVHTNSSNTAGKVTAMATPNIEWHAVSLGEDGYGVPSTKVTVAINGKSYEAGKYQGNCNTADAKQDIFGNKVPADALSPIMDCYWAGGGDVVAVFKDADGYSVKTAQYGEPSPEAGPSVLSDFKEVAAN